MQIINSDQIGGGEADGDPEPDRSDGGFGEGECGGDASQGEGFVDPVVSITDGKADVVVNAASLTDQERAQIEDIVKRKTDIGADGIVITLLDAEE